MLEGIRGRGFTGDIAIDDITYTVGACPVQPKEALPTMSTTSPPPVVTTRPPKGAYDCDFESDFCGWAQDSAASFNWTRASGSTSSTNTGPRFDHTLNNSEYDMNRPLSVSFILIYILLLC